MSGRKQHYIPQFLLRAFGKERKKGQYQVRVHLPERTFITATEGAAAEREFYSVVRTDSETLDDKITSAEANYAKLHRDLLSARIPDANAVARLLSHLTVRGAHLRDSVAHLASSGIELIAEAYSDPETFRRGLGLHGSQPSGPFKKAIDEKYDKLCEIAGRRFMPRYDFQMLAHRLAQSRFDELFDDSLMTNSVFSAMVTSEAPQMAADGQRKALSQDLEPAARVQAYESLSWQAIDYSTPCLILPDSVAVVRNSDSSFTAPMYSDLEDLEYVYLPVSANRLLVGSSADLPATDSNFNALAAATSWDIFISHPEATVPERLSGKIRSGMKRYIEELMARTLAEAMEG